MDYGLVGKCLMTFGLSKLKQVWEVMMGVGGTNKHVYHRIVRNITLSVTYKGKGFEMHMRIHYKYSENENNLDIKRDLIALPLDY